MLARCLTANVDCHGKKSGEPHEKNGIYCIANAEKSFDGLIKSVETVYLNLLHQMPSL